VTVQHLGITIAAALTAAAMVLAAIAVLTGRRSAPGPAAPDAVPAGIDRPMSPVDQAETATAWPSLVSSYYRRSR
jgi:hypothetical protein